MRNVTEISSTQDHRSMELQHLLIACEFVSWVAPEFKMLLLKLSLGRNELR